MTGIEHYIALAEPYLREYGIAAVFVMVCLEAFGMPLPGESLVIASGFLASRGDINIVLLIGAIWSAAVLGDNIGYSIGRYGGRHLVLRHGARVGITEPRLAKVESVFSRYGGEIVMVARFFVGLRQLNGLIAGTVAMPWPRFLLYNAVGAALWTGVWGYGAYVAGHHLAAILPWFHRFGYAAIALAAVAVVVFLAIHYSRARRAK